MGALNFCPIRGERGGPALVRTREDRALTPPRSPRNPPPATGSILNAPSRGKSVSRILNYFLSASPPARALVLRSPRAASWSARLLELSRVQECGAKARLVSSARSTWRAVRRGGGDRHRWSRCGSDRHRSIRAIALRGSDSNGEKNNNLQERMCSVSAASRLPGRLHGGQQQADQDKTSAFLRHERAPMMTVGSRESVSTPQGVWIKPTGHTFAPTRRVGLSTFPLATDPVSTAISE